MKALLTGLIAVGAGFAFLWPAGERHASASSSGEIVLYRSSDRHFYADGIVEGHSIRFLVDTGSSAVTLTPADAKKLGIEVAPGEYRMIGHGTSGLIRGKFVEVATIQISGFQQSDAKVAIVEGSSVSLLGQPFLDQFDEIVIRKERMTLRFGQVS